MSNYRTVMIDYFNRLKTNAPAWIIQLGTHIVPPLCWGECLPTIEQLQTTGRKHCLQHLPRLKTLVERAAGEWDATSSAQEAERLKRQRNALVEICSSAREWVSSADLREGDKLSIWLAFVSSFSGIGKKLEDKVFLQAKETVAAGYPGSTPSRDDATQILRLLDDYDQAVESLIMPFVRDREVLRVSLNSPLRQVCLSRQISRVKASEPVAKAKSGLIMAATRAEESIEHWTSVKHEAMRWSPAGRLCQTLRAMLAAERLEDLQAGLGSDNPQDAIVALTNRSEIIRLLDDLHLQELVALENNVCREMHSTQSAKPDTRQGIIQSILVAIGLPVNASSRADNGRNAELLKEKAAREQFDIFLAHNAEDREIVLRLGRRLRSHGIYPWIDVEQVPPGRWFQDVLQSPVRTVKSAAVLIGKSGIGKWQAVEMGAFISRCVENGIPIIPVLLSGVITIPEELIFLRGLHQVCFKSDMIEDAEIAPLIWGITGEKPPDHLEQSATIHPK